MAFELLRRHDFLETALHFSRALRTLTAKVGRPEKFHQTITLAFLSLVAERLAAGGHGDFETFAAANPDLLTTAVLERWYSPERLASPTARDTFLLPDRRHGGLHEALGRAGGC